jgi:DNA mismatch repair protein MSH5
MAQRFKRKRQASYTSSSTRTAQSRASQRGRSQWPSVPAQRSSQSRAPGIAHGQAATRLNSSQDSVPSGRQSQYAVELDVGTEDLEQVVMAIDRQQKGAIGCAYYVAREEKLYCLQDLVNGTLDSLETCEFLFSTITMERLTVVSESGPSTDNNIVIS